MRATLSSQLVPHLHPKVVMIIGITRFLALTVIGITRFLALTAAHDLPWLLCSGKLGLAIGQP